MAQTRSQTAKLNAENQIRNLSIELQNTQAINKNLLKELDESSEEFKNLLTQNSALKTALAEKDKMHLDFIQEINELKQQLELRLGDLCEYEEALNVIRMHDKNASLFEELEKTIRSGAEQSIKVLNYDLNCLRNELIAVQSENLQLRNSLDNNNASTKTVTSTTTNKNSIDIQRDNKKDNKFKKKVSERKTSTKHETINKNNSKKKQLKAEQVQQKIDTAMEKDQTNKEKDIITVDMYKKDQTERKEDEKTNNKKTQNKKQMLILCDHYGKGIAEYVKNRAKEYNSVLSMCKPGATLQEITKSAGIIKRDMIEEDDIIVIYSNPYNFSLGYIKHIRELCKEKKLKLQVMTLPYDKNFCINDNYNIMVGGINNNLSNLINRSPGMSLIDINEYNNRSIFKTKEELTNKFKNFLYNKIILNSMFEYTHLFNNVITLTKDSTRQCVAKQHVVIAPTNANGVFLDQEVIDITTI